MYTLRKVSEHFTHDTYLTNEYSVVCKQNNEESFVKRYLEMFPKETEENAIKSDIVKIVITSYCIPIHKQDLYYIVMPNGETLTCLNNPRRNK